MVKLQDFVIGGFVLMIGLLGAVLFIGQGASSYGLSAQNASFVNISKIDDLTRLANEADAQSSEQESGVLDNLAKLFRAPIAAVQGMKASTSILFDFFTNAAEEYGIDPRFVYILTGILTILFVVIFVALLTGRFV